MTSDNDVSPPETELAPFGHKKDQSIHISGQEGTDIGARGNERESSSSDGGLSDYESNKKHHSVSTPDRAPFGHRKDTSLENSSVFKKGRKHKKDSKEKATSANGAYDSESEKDFEVQMQQNHKADGSLMSGPAQNSFRKSQSKRKGRFEHSKTKRASQRGQSTEEKPNPTLWRKVCKKLDRVFPVMHPLTHVMAIENMAFGLLVIYSLFSSTYQVAFNQVPEGGWLIFEILVNVAFYADCCLQFRVGYFGGSKLPPSARKRIIELGGTVPDVIMDPDRVAWRYLTTWFTIDFISSFPFEAVFAFKSISRPSGVKLLMLLKFLRLPRFWHARDQVRRYLGQNLDEIVSTMTTLTGIYFYCHVMGCIFWYIVMREHSPNNFAAQSMWDDAGTLKPLNVAPPGVAYLSVLYFCIISVTSVGYGDLEPGPTLPERLWAIFNATGAALCLGYVVGQITSVVSTKRARQFQLRERFEVLQKVIENEQIPDMLVTRMTQHLASTWERSIYRYNEDELRNELPAKIRAELGATWWLRVIRPSPFFPHDFSYLRTILTASERQLCPPGDYIVHEGQVSKTVYVLRKGRAMISSSRAVQRESPSEDQVDDTEGQLHTEEMHSARQKGRSRQGRMKCSLTREYLKETSKWFKKIKHRGDNSESPSYSDSEDSEGARASEQDDDEMGDPSAKDQRPKKRWEVGPGTVIGERALLNAMAKRAREVGSMDDWDQIKLQSVVMDVTAKLIDESQVISIPIEDLVIGDFPPLLDELKDALERFEYAAPGFVENGESDK